MSEHITESPNEHYLVRDYIGYLIPVAGTIVCMLIAIAVKEDHKDTYEVFRDLAIGFFVAFIVTIIYEVYARNRYERKSFVNTMQAIMNEVVHPGVWEEVRNQIIEKNMIREDGIIRLNLESEGLPNGQMVLCLEFEYDLRGLRSKPQEVNLSHYLDDHIKCEEKDLPRFELINLVGKVSYDRATLKSKIRDGVFTYNVTLNQRNKKPIHVITRRKEITYVPGSYNLVMGDVTKGVTLIVEKLPPGIVVHLNLWPHTSKPIPLQIDTVFDEFSNKILLAGQACEFRFTPEQVIATDQKDKQRA